MNHTTLADSLVVMQREAANFNYALLRDSNVIKMLVPFMKEKLITRDKSEIMNMIEGEARKYNGVPAMQVRKSMIEEMVVLYKIPKRRLDTKQETVDQWERVVEHMHHHMYKKDKKFQAFLKHNKTSSQVEDIVKFQMYSLVDSISNKTLSKDDMENIGASLEEFLLTLPEDQQREVARKLGINEITSSTIQQLIATNGTAAVFGVIVQVAGFAFYTTLTSVTATVFGLVGLTLPFGFYTTLTSLVAVMANPLFLLPALLAVGGGALKWQNDKLKKAIAPIVLMQIVMMGDENSTPDWEAFVHA